MDALILSQIPLSELLDQVRKAVREEITAGSILSERSTESNQTINSKELAGYLQVTEQTLANWRKRGKIPCIQLGANVRYQLPAVLKALSK